MLNQFDEITAPHPPHILKRFVPLLPAYGELEKDENMSRLVEDICTLVELNPVPWHLMLDRKEIKNRCRENTLFEIFRVIYDLKAEQEQASIWVCKSMSNVNYFQHLESFEKKPMYIHLIRDGRDVSCSFRNTIVGEKHIYNLADFWKKEQKACIDLKNIVGEDRVLRVKYEDLIRDPETVMRKVSEFLGLSFTHDVFNFYKSNDSWETARAGRMWQNLTRPILKGNFNKYKKQLSPGDILLFEHLAGDMLEFLDYDLDFPEERMKIKIRHEDIFYFNRLNDQMKQEALRAADSEDLKKRDGQKRLLENIAGRVVKVKKLEYSENQSYEKKAII